MRVFLFDIDGTLLRGNGAGRRAMDRALRDALMDVSIAGEASSVPTRNAAWVSPFEGVRFDGNTDRRIVREALDRLGLETSGQPGFARPSGLETTPRIVDQVLSRYVRALEDELVSAPFRALAGAAEAASALAAHGGVGLGTGNIEAAALRKLAAVGMAHLFGFGGYGSDAEERSELLEVGAVRGAEQLGVSRATCEVVVIGDTVRDIVAARAIGARVVAVATGGTPSSELEAHRPDALLGSLADVHEVLRAVLGA